VGRSLGLISGRPDQRKGVWGAEEAAAEQNGGWMLEAAGRAVSPAEDGRCITGQYLRWTKNRKVWVVPVVGADAGALVQEPPALEPQQKTLWAEARKESERGKDQFKIRDLLADEVQPAGTGLPLLHGCGKAGPAPGWDDDTQREASERELRGRRERGEERRRPGSYVTAVRNTDPLFLPTSSFMATTEGE